MIDLAGSGDLQLNSKNSEKFSQNFYRDGYVVLNNIISRNLATQLKREIEDKVTACSKKLGIQKQDYLSAVSRWVHPSPITSVVSPIIIKRLSQSAEAFIGKPVHLKKMNVICKNAYCTGVIPYHQDISYSPKEPYEFSMWIALNDISPESGPMEVIPGSHLYPLKPAVDFWSPHYKPDLALKQKAKELTLSAGDCIIFDSRLWHGSSANTDLSSRYALVVRWTSEGWQYEKPIPDIIPSDFGMWTSGQMTEDLLGLGLRLIFTEEEQDFIQIIDSWMRYMQEGLLPFPCNVTLAIDSLKYLKVLHLAHTHHNGGDAIGVVYRNCWCNFLLPLQDYISEMQTKGNAA